MKKLASCLALLACGCTVTGTAFVEKDLPDGKAGAKVEVRLTPPPVKEATWPGPTTLLPVDESGPPPAATGLVLGGAATSIPVCRYKIPIKGRKGAK